MRIASGDAQQAIENRRRGAAVARLHDQVFRCFVGENRRVIILVGAIDDVERARFGQFQRRAALGFFQKRSEEHTSELQSLTNLVCRLLLEKKKKYIRYAANNQYANSITSGQTEITWSTLSH